MRKLGDYVFPAGAIWANFDTYVSYATSIQRSTTGRPIVYQRDLTKGQPIQISFSQCFLSRVDVETLKLMASTSNTYHLFEWDSFSTSVIFAQNPHEFTPVHGVYTTDLSRVKWTGNINVVSV